MSLSASKIRSALAYVHGTEKRDGRASSTQYAIRMHALNQEEAEILANALHIRPGEIDIPHEVARGKEIERRMTHIRRSR